VKKLLISAFVCSIAMLAACGDDSSSTSASESGSSSSAKESSSSTDSLPNTNGDESKFDYGSLKDERDGKTYKTIVIGEQTWMAENLNYDYKEKNYCYDNNDDKCAKLGRLYEWPAAMDAGAKFSDANKGCYSGVVCNAKEPVRGVCPEGWHLPSESEWKTLFTFVGGEKNATCDLMSEDTPYGRELYGFSVLLAGYHDDFFQGLNEYAMFWTSSEHNEVSSQYVYFYDVCTKPTGFARGQKYRAKSVRCVKD